MSGEAVVFMLLVGGFVWGGFATLIIRAVRSEASKGRARGGDGSDGG